jgi:hypothetical protein
MGHFSISSQTQANKSTSKDLFEFMGNFNHFKHLLPEEKIEDFECTDSQCSFQIKGLTKLTIKIKEKTPIQKITFQTEGLAKFIFTLHIHFLSENQSKVELEGDMNPFIKVMAEKPLTELVNTMATKLAKLELNGGV